MRNLKKFLALVLAMMMAFSLMVTANAANPGTQYGDVDGVTPAFEEAVDVLTGMGVYSGDNGNFRPASTITRAEVAALIYRLATGDVTDAQEGLYAEYGNFPDVAHDAWYAGYVGYCANAGYIKGRSNGNFDPAGNVTGYEALAMILRAIGYDKNGEFTGAAWQTEVSALSQQLHILDNVKTTQYGGTLYLPARRDVVADLLFRADAYVHMVNYTPAFGYQPYGNINSNNGSLTGGTANDTLGYKVFGLKDTTRIVLGNQYTGESGTVLGAEKDNTVEYNNTTDDVFASYTMYDYPGTVLVAKGATVKVGTGNGSSGTTPANTNDIVVVPTSEGLKLDAKTDLEWFGHKAKFWYDATDSASAKHTYAWIDKAEKAEYVTVIDNTTANPNPTNTTGETGVLSVPNASDVLTNNSATLNPTLGRAAIDAGFSVKLGGTLASGGSGTAGSTAYWSDQYSRINAPTAMATLPGRVRTLAGATGTANDESPINMYYVVSNSSDKSVDVVVSLNANVGRITERNTTATTKSLTLGQNPTFANQKPFYANDNSVSNRIGNESTPDGTIWLDQLTPDSVQTLNSVVTAWEVKGTSIQTYASTKYTGNSTVDAVGLARSDYYYDLKSPIDTITGTVRTYRYQDATPANVRVPECTITLTDGTVLKQSGMFDSVYTGAGIGQNWASGIAVGVTYTFYMDKAGRFLGWSAPNEYSFLYATFGDYQVGGLGTGTIGYHVTGVNWDGEIVENHVLTSMTIPVGQTATPTDEWDKWGTSTSPSTASNVIGTLPGLRVEYPDATNNRTLAQGYNLLPITKKDLGTAVVGNQIAEGADTGFMIDPQGDMTWLVPQNQGMQFMGWQDNASPMIGSATNNNFEWTITDDDADRGFVRVYNNSGITTGNQSAYLLTNDTKFIVVTGSGTADLSVKTYNGLKDLVGDGTEAVISVANAAGTAFDQKADEVWFKGAADRFGTVLTGNNATIDTVIMADKNLSRYSTESLFYNFDQTNSTGAVLPTAGANVEQYRLWNGGELGVYFIDWSKSTTTAPAAWANKGGIEADTFYTLTPIDEVNGVTVYKATAQAKPTTLNYTQDCTVGSGSTTATTYQYIVVNNLSTAELTVNGVTLPYSVSNAKVCDVQWLTAQANGTLPLTPMRSQITSIEELHNAVSVKDAAGTTQVYTVNVAVTMDGSNVDTIYIYSIT